ncbi:MAG: hypothetical protein NC124_02125 [Clostridium sp.]|nr:hypothetical protein [Clostridium sp.]
MKVETKVWLETSDEFSEAIQNGKTVFNVSGDCFRRTENNKWIILEDEEGVEYIIPNVEFEKDVYFYVEEDKVNG